MDGLGGDVRLSCASPCIDAGAVDAWSGSVDAEGEPRELDGDSDGTPTADMGADEFGLLWSAPGTPQEGDWIAFRAEAPPAFAGQTAFVMLSLGSGAASGGIAVPGTALTLGLDPDGAFQTWNACPPFLRTVVLGPCPGASTPLIPLLPGSAGFRVYYAGVSYDGTLFTGLSPTRSLLVSTAPGP